MKERKFDPKEINLTIDNVTCGASEKIHPFIVIEWSSNIGWGEYTFYKDGDAWKIDPETMDDNEDKAFGKALLELWLEQCEVI